MALRQAADDTRDSAGKVLILAEKLSRPAPPAILPIHFIRCTHTDRLLGPSYCSSKRRTQQKTLVNNAQVHLLLARIPHSPPAATAYLMPSGRTCLDRRLRRISIRLQPHSLRQVQDLSQSTRFLGILFRFHLSPGSTNDPLGGSLDRVATKFVRNPG